MQLRHSTILFTSLTLAVAYKPSLDPKPYGTTIISENRKKSCALESSSYHSFAPDSFQPLSGNRTDRTVDIPINYHVIYLEGDSIFMNVTVDNQPYDHTMWDIRDYDNSTFLLYPGIGFDYPSHSYSKGGILPAGNYALFLYDEFGTGGISASVTTSDGTVLASVQMGTWTDFTFLDFTAPTGSYIDGLVSDEIIEAQTTVLNTFYNSFGYSFYTAGIDSAVNAGWHYATDSHKFETDQWDNDDQFLAMNHAMNVDVPTSINFYWTGATLTSGLGVYPWSFPEDSASHGLYCANYTFPGSDGNFSEGYTGVHEVGHYFGLYHTFENGCTAPGDEVNDTPEQEEANYGCPSNPYSCNSYDDVGNFMDYMDDVCLNHFTQGQIDRMDWALETYRPSLLSANTIIDWDFSLSEPVIEVMGADDEWNPGDTISIAMDFCNNTDVGHNWYPGVTIESDSSLTSLHSGHIWYYAMFADTCHTISFSVLANSSVIADTIVAFRAYPEALNCQNQPEYCIDGDTLTFEVPIVVQVVSTESEIIPSEFALHPPYPNPFNPIATIRFSVGNTDRYSLHVFDITGRVVETLLNGKKNPGQYEIQWNATRHASGIYFVELIAGGKRDVQKLILLK